MAASDIPTSKNPFYLDDSTMITSKKRYDKRGIIKEYITDIQHILAIETMVGGEKNYDKLVKLYNKNLPVELQITNLDEIDSTFTLYDKGVHYETVMYDLSEKRLHNLERKLYNETKDYIMQVKPYSEMLLHLFISIRNDETARSFIRHVKKHSVSLKTVHKETNMNVLDRCLQYIDMHPHNKFQLKALHTLLEKGHRFHKYSDPFDTKDLTTIVSKSLLAESFLHSSRGKEKIKDYDEKFRKVHPLEAALDDSMDSSVSYSPVETRKLGKSRNLRKTRKGRTSHRSKTRKSSISKSSSRSSSRPRYASKHTRRKKRTHTRRRKYVIDSSDSE